MPLLVSMPMTMTMTMSFDRPPAQVEAAHQGIDAGVGLLVGVAGQMGVAGGREDAVVAQDVLNILQADTGLDQVGCIAVAKAVGGDLFFRPQAMAT